MTSRLFIRRDDDVTVNHQKDDVTADKQLIIRRYDDTTADTAIHQKV